VIGLFTRLMMVEQLMAQSGCSREEAEEIADCEIDRRLAAMAPRPIKLNEPRPGSYLVPHDSGWVH
jgi:hypothetical protein